MVNADPTVFVCSGRAMTVVIPPSDRPTTIEFRSVYDPRTREAEMARACRASEERLIDLIRRGAFDL